MVLYAQLHNEERCRSQVASRRVTDLQVGCQPGRDPCYYLPIDKLKYERHILQVELTCGQPRLLNESPLSNFKITVLQLGRHPRVKLRRSAKLASSEPLNNVSLQTLLGRLYGI